MPVDDAFFEPAPYSAPDAVSRFLSFRIARTHYALNAQSARILKREAGITLGQWRIIALIAGGASTSRELAQKSGFDPAFVSRTIAGMEPARLIATSRAKDDKRVLELRLRREGRELYERIFPVMRERQRALFGALSPEEGRLICGALEKIEAAADAFEA